MVDRKDLDYQTMREYDRFEKGAANSNTSTAVLKKQLEDPSAKIIITTIQKLSTFIAANKGHAVYNGHVVIIFDECHRSQFGDMHTAITRHSSGTTSSGSPARRSSRSTPAVEATRTCAPRLRRSVASCTATRRGARVSSTRWRSMPTRSWMPSATRTSCRSASTTSTPSKLPEGLPDKQVSAIDTGRALLAPERLSRWLATRWSTSIRRPSVPSTTRSPASASTASTPCSPRPRSTRRSTTTPSSRPSRWTCRPIERLKVGTIYSYAANEDVGDDYLDEEGFETSSLDQSSRDFLDGAIE